MKLNVSSVIILVTRQVSVEADLSTLPSHSTLSSHHSIRTRGVGGRRLVKNEKCGLELSAHNQQNRGYVDSGFYKHMTRHKSKFLLLKDRDKGNNVAFGNNALAKNKGKGIDNLNEKSKAQNVLYMEGLKLNLLSVIQMCDFSI